HPRQCTKERVGGVIWYFGHQRRRGVLHVELFTPCHHTQHVVEGIHALLARPTIKIRPLKLDGPSQGFDRTADEIASLPDRMTPRAGSVMPVVFTTVDMRHDRLGDAPGELLA